MGHGLEKMISRGRKLTIQVAEGKKRLDVPLQAAKLASETGVALRDNMPIYPSWKLYEDEAGQAEVTKVLEKVAVRQLFIHCNTILHYYTAMQTVCIINYFYGCSQDWMWMLKMRDQAKRHALISSRGE